MNLPNLLKEQAYVITTTLEGMAYVKNSLNQGDHLCFFTTCIINTLDNSVLVQYMVRVFKDKKADSFEQIYSNYAEAIAKYNELAIKWNRDRIIEEAA